MINLIMVALGGALGSAGRYGMSLLLKGAGFWAGTLAVNLIGCFLLGLLYTRGAPEHAQGRALFLGVSTGVLGGFTTFSTFSVDTVRFIERGGALPAALYVALSVLGGIALAYAGYTLGRAS